MPTQLPLLPYLEAETSQRPADFIPVYTPWLGDREAEYVLEAVQSGWISSLGKYVVQFEEEFSRFCGRQVRCGDEQRHHGPAPGDARWA